MKFSAAILSSLVASAAAFTVPSPSNGRTTLLRSTELETESSTAPADVNANPEKMMMQEDQTTMMKEPALPEMSQSMPFMKRPVALTGALAGDVGFDPLGFATTEQDLMNFREAEVKHARLAMLAAAGWPLSEVFDKKIAGVFGLAPVLDASDRAPSVLNGGLGKISPVYWAVCLGAAAVIDLYGISRSRENTDEYFPGNLGFDPLGIFPADEEGQKWMQTAEIKNGRLAMIAITAFAVQEAVSQSGVVDETPFFFFPVMETLHNYANAGYL